LQARRVQPGNSQGRAEATVSKPVRIGFVGCGEAMSKPYMSLIDKLLSRGKVELTAACDIVDKRDFVRDGFGIPYFTTDYRELVERDDVDLVLVLSAMATHGPITKAALLAGKHVLVEKPMAVELDQAEELVELARTSPGYLLCAPYVILSPTYHAVARHIQNGDIGRPLTARARYGWAGPWWGQWFYKKGGGALFDLGVYNLTSLTGLLGPARRVTSFAGIAIPERVVDGELMRVEAEDNIQILLDFGNSVFACLTAGFTMQRMRSPAIEIYGTEGTLQMLGEDWAPAGYEMWQNQAQCWKVYEETDRHWHWAIGIDHIVDCIQRGIPPVIQPEHALNVLEIMLKAKESAEDGNTKALVSSFEPPQFAELHAARLRHLVHDPSTPAE
jgi:predicted dehydrogenase